MLSARFSEIFDNVNQQLSGERLKPFIPPDPEPIQPSCVRNPTEKWGVQVQDPNERILPLPVHFKKANVGLQLTQTEEERKQNVVTIGGLSQNLSADLCGQLRRGDRVFVRKIWSRSESDSSTT